MYGILSNSSLLPLDSGVKVVPVGTWFKHFPTYSAPVPTTLSPVFLPFSKTIQAQLEGKGGDI